MNKVELTSEDFLNYAMAFESHHSIFYKFWSMGLPEFTDDIPTAAVLFDESGEFLRFQFNSEFWNRCTFEERLFVIAHECLHIIYRHGLRIIDAQNVKNANKAADLVVNHSLETKFGFDRGKIDPTGRYCWVDTVFGVDSGIATDKSFEYYYALLNERKSTKNAELVDSHDWKNVINHDEFEQFLDKKLDKFEKELLQDMFNNTEAGSSSSSTQQWKFTGEAPKKKKWETVIKEWTRKKIKEASRDEEQWTREDRRFIAMGNDFMLPSMASIEAITNEKHRIMVFFFLDTSGSCWNLKDRFFKAARSLPDEFFDVKLFCFDDSVYETTLASGNVYGGGGTRFDIIETEIRRIGSLNERDYPDAVFLITDGWGNVVNPIHPERWYWFLSGGYTNYIPDKSQVFRLKDYE